MGRVPQLLFDKVGAAKALPKEENDGKPKLLNKGFIPKIPLELGFVALGAFDADPLFELDRGIKAEDSEFESLGDKEATEDIPVLTPLVKGDAPKSAIKGGGTFTKLPTELVEDALETDELRERSAP